MSDATSTDNRAKGEVRKGLVAGLVGGLFASWTMNRFQDVWMKFSANGDSPGEQPTEQKKKVQAEQPKTGDNEEQDDTTVKAASALSKGILGHRLTKDEK